MALSLTLLLFLWIPPSHPDATISSIQGVESSGKLLSGKFPFKFSALDSKIIILKQLLQSLYDLFLINQDLIWRTSGLLLIFILGVFCLIRYFSPIRQKEEKCKEFSSLSPVSICSTALPLAFSPKSLDLNESCNIGLWNEQLDNFTDNGTYLKNFEEKRLLWETPEESVYLATHKLDMEDYLVKKIPFSLNFENSIKDSPLFQEINKIKRINCRHVARYVTCWIEESPLQFPETCQYNVILYIQMEYIQGSSLKTVFHSDLTKKAGLKIIRQVCKIVHYLHTQGYSHGDLSMENIFIDRYNRVMVGDFNMKNCFCDDHRRVLELVQVFIKNIGQGEDILKELLENEFIVKSELQERVAYIVRNS